MWFCLFFATSSYFKLYYSFPIYFSNQHCGMGAKMRLLLTQMDPVKLKL